MEKGRSCSGAWAVETSPVPGAVGSTGSSLPRLFKRALAQVSQFSVPGVDPMRVHRSLFASRHSTYSRQSLPQPRKPADRRREMGAEAARAAARGEQPVDLLNGLRHRTDAMTIATQVVFAAVRAGSALARSNATMAFNGLRVKEDPRRRHGNHRSSPPFEPRQADARAFAAPSTIAAASDCLPQRKAVEHRLQQGELRSDSSCRSTT